MLITSKTGKLMMRKKQQKSLSKLLSYDKKSGKNGCLTKEKKVGKVAIS